MDTALIADAASPETGNRLLASLPAASLARLQPHLESRSIGQRQELFHEGEAVTYVYFPVTCIISLLIHLGDGTAVESGIVGNDGLVGLPAVLNVAASRRTAICQVPGSALCLPATAFQEALAQDEALHLRVHRYTYGMFVQTSQRIACNRRHQLAPRFASWLLQIHDRVPNSEFNLTQDFLAVILGVRRATVNEAVGQLKRAGAIDYRYGTVRVRDREALAAVSCECYSVIAQEAERALH